MTEITFRLSDKEASYKENTPRVPVEKKELAKILLPWVLRHANKTRGVVIIEDGNK
ncbi:MAG: hypothetical protein ABSC17_05825 [Thermacetogeniaceae bacterium]